MSDILDELDRIDALKAEADLVLLRERDVRHIPIITLPFGDEHEAKYALATMNAYPRLAAEIRRLGAESASYAALIRHHDEHHDETAKLRAENARIVAEKGIP